MPKKYQTKANAGYILINPVRNQEKTEGGIIIPNDYKRSSIRKGIAIDIGSPVGNLPRQVRYMDTVLFDEGKAILYEENDQKMMIVKQNNVLAVL